MEERYSYEEFKNVLLVCIKKIFGEGASIELHNIIKNNSLELEGMVILEKGKCISPNFYLQIYYEEYLCGRSVGDIVEDILEKYGSMEDKELGSFSMEACDCMDKIVCRLVSYEKNSRLLEEIPYIPFLDLAVIFSCLVVEDECGIGSIRISNKIMEQWGITVKMLYQVAVNNTQRLFPKVLCPLKSMMVNILEGDEEAGWIPAGIINEIQDGGAPFVLTNQRGINGAAVILYPGCLKEISDATGKDLYIIPSSIHELLVIPDDKQIMAGDIKKMVHEVNTNCVVAEEVLSDMVYKYSAERNCIEICI